MVGEEMAAVATAKVAAATEAAAAATEAAATGWAVEGKVAAEGRLAEHHCKQRGMRTRDVRSARP